MQQPARQGRLFCIVVMLIFLYGCATHTVRRQLPVSPDSASTVIIRDGKRMFYADRYEVSNKRYGRFIAAGGYSNRQWWSNRGWQWRTKNSITSPRWWANGRFQSGPGFPDHPVVGVSYYEAAAFARWAGKSLPSLQEFRVMAGKRNWPWGDDPPAAAGLYYANMLGWQDGSFYTARVDAYPAGNTPAGAAQLAGNVCEWTATGSGESSVLCVGGSWNSPLEENWRRYTVPRSKSARLETVGFRCVQR